MNLILLDIDGVLATEKCSHKPNHELFAYPFEKECVLIFNEILLETEAQIVLSSDWRLMYNNDLVLLDDLFKYNGVIRSPIDVTPNLGRNRENEITAYLKSNLNKISTFAILDDLDLKTYPENFVKCNINYGIKELGIKEKIKSIFIKLENDRKSNR